jgi:hypothetical protein
MRHPSSSGAAGGAARTLHLHVPVRRGGSVGAFNSSDTGSDACIACVRHSSLPGAGPAAEATVLMWMEGGVINASTFLYYCYCLSESEPRL